MSIQKLGVMLLQALGEWVSFFVKLAIAAYVGSYVVFAGVNTIAFATAANDMDITPWKLFLKFITE